MENDIYQTLNSNLDVWYFVCSISWTSSRQSMFSEFFYLKACEESGGGLVIAGKVGRDLKLNVLAFIKIFFCFEKQKLQILEALHIKNIQAKLNRINFETSANVLKWL